MLVTSEKSQSRYQRSNILLINRCLRNMVAWSYLKFWTTSRTSLEPTNQVIERQQWRWLGHAFRKDHTDSITTKLEMEPQGLKRRRRSRETWIGLWRKTYAELAWSRIERVTFEIKKELGRCFRFQHTWKGLQLICKWLLTTWKRLHLICNRLHLTWKTFKFLIIIKNANAMYQMSKRVY